MADTSGPVLVSASMMEAAIYGQPPAIPRLLESEKEESRELRSFFTCNEGPAAIEDNTAKDTLVGYGTQH